MNFKDWLESATTSGDIAVFVRPTIGIVKRHWPWTEEDPFFNKKKKKKKLVEIEIDKFPLLLNLRK